MLPASVDNGRVPGVFIADAIGIGFSMEVACWMAIAMLIGFSTEVGLVDSRCNGD